MIWLTQFPTLRVDIAGPIDALVRYINIHYGILFVSMKRMLGSFIGGLQDILQGVPWWILILLVVLGGSRLWKSYGKGALFGFLLFFVGLLGYWDMMCETLAIVLSAVLFSLLMGIPIGILLASLKGAESILTPFLDAMQTMPTFVYMIPAVMLLGPGKVPAVLATVVYAIVPVIRLTSHGIRQVDPEVVEASHSFGASRWQVLWTVQLPQALPTIMTGINQTMMMAVAMVVTSSMIGANGLGMEVLIAINRMEAGRGLSAGLSIVIIAILLDRLTQSLVRKEE
ncbi:MAG: ABC transporter permease subunit [Acidaminococcus sp.]|jgi:ABC-type proline/glycine betaine transport system permease subunit|nr:ABC transporter permease subunit [Acidaminococcus sp.]MCI2100189.1 ABC transporter permease subunit [Acidaminococcus sp.]MCI2114508.1 ABC transporter permease subunit [Acidaminococcus sp.]MCI2116488.1 ABC transporter permease subunit [Acidaminococcus sp.]